MFRNKILIGNLNESYISKYCEDINKALEQLKSCEREKEILILESIMKIVNEIYRENFHK